MKLIASFTHFATNQEMAEKALLELESKWGEKRKALVVVNFDNQMMFLNGPFPVPVI